MKVKVTHLCLTLCDPMDYNSPWSSLGQNTGVPFPSPGDLPNSGIKPRSPALQADSLPAEPQGKSSNTAVSSLSSPADLPDAGIEPGSPTLQMDCLPTELSGKLAR